MNCANHPDRERIAFCQNCGKPLCQECARTVGTAVFCEPCLEARLAGSAPPSAAGAGYAGMGGVNFTTSATGGSYTDPGYVPPPSPTGAPNPGLAALLGFIPGVGAMYNGQYAKGVVHLIIFAVLVSLADEHGIFGLFVTGWIFYQVFEAYGTARARRDGTPLPNPFGLNDLGERLGFGRSWSTGAPIPPAAPADAYAPPPVPPPAPYTPPANAYTPPAASAVPPQQAPWDAPWSSYAPPSANPYMSATPPFDPNAYPAPRNRFPAGAIWLIGLGVIFLIGNANIFHGFPVHYLLPFLLIGIGLWLFIHKMTATGATLADDGTAFYRVRLFSALRGSVWVILVGVMFLLANFRILSWGRSWPLFIIVAGLMTFFERTAYHSATAPAYPAAPYQPVTPAGSPTSVVPPSTPAETQNPSNEEGR
jgi:hypothetical protein